MLTSYGQEVQRLFINFMLSDPQNYVRVQNIYNVENFDRGLRQVAEFIKEYADKYHTLPDKVQLKATTGFEVDLGNIDESHYDWFLDEFESFTRRKELERAILESADLLEKGEYGPVEAIIKKAVQISLTRDLGTDYFKDPLARLTEIKDRKNMVTTGWADLDNLLYGGFNKGDLQIFAANSGGGKSLVMQNLAVNWVESGLWGVYITLELSESLCASRLDSMTTGVDAASVLRDIEDVAMKVKIKGRTSGGLHIKYMPAQSTVNDIRAYLKELEIQLGRKIDFLCVDYLDLLMPISAKVSPSDLFVKDKYVSEELRNLAKELNVLFVTASQFNRSAVEELEFSHAHISGGISKINTADNVFGILLRASDRDSGRVHFQALKTRSSSGVGKKIELGFDQGTLRIINLSDDEKKVNPTSLAGNAVLQQAKAKSRMPSYPAAGKILDSDTGEILDAPVATMKLNDLMARMKPAGLK